MVEDKSIPNMIKTLGFPDAIRYFGEYEKIEGYITNKDKVNYIKEKVAELGRGGVSFREINADPIFYDENGQIEFLGRDRAYVYIYYNGNVGDVRVEYENLPSEILDELFRVLIDK